MLTQKLQKLSKIFDKAISNSNFLYKLSRLRIYLESTLGYSITFMFSPIDTAVTENKEGLIRFPVFVYVLPEQKKELAPISIDELEKIALLRMLLILIIPKRLSYKQLSDALIEQLTLNIDTYYNLLIKADTRLKMDSELIKLINFENY